jgi:hypothetical protein
VLVLVDDVLELVLVVKVLELVLVEVLELVDVDVVEVKDVRTH